MPRTHKKDTLTPTALTLEISTATNILLSIVAVLLLVLAIAVMGFWEHSNP